MSKAYITILQCGALTDTYGGIESYIFQQLKNINRKKFKYEFLVPKDMCEVAYEKEVNMLGAKIHHNWVGRKNGILKHYIELYKFFRTHKYDAVVCNVLNLKNVDCLLFATWFRVPIRIIHAHSAGTNENPLFFGLIEWINYLLLGTIATNFFACSDKAGEWLFRKKWKLNKLKDRIIHNGIDVSRYLYSQDTRAIVRKFYDLEDKLVIGHTGRLAFGKNHGFIIDVFNEIQKKEKNAMLLLVGKGPLKDVLEKKIKKLSLEKKVLFLGERKDVYDLLQAMDIFLFPSESEGLGISVIEAQVSGLKSFASKEGVPYDTKITPLLKFISLSESPRSWAEKILKEIKYRREIQCENDNILEYDIKNTVYEIENFYSLNFRE